MALRRIGRRTLGGQRRHELFPGFTDVQEIGVGSLAVVFRAREIGTNRLVALKLLNVRDASPRSIESFERESIALGALSSHPNIVTLYRTFRTGDGRPVLVLELCSGAVADRLHNGSGLPVSDAVAIGIKIAGALETAHRGGILHRDVKPQNILLTDFGEPALADFGVAMLQSSTQTTAGLFDFTTLHAAPELLEGGGTSAATDVYELASSLYQLIAGQSAFRAYEGESPASVILRILRDPVRPLFGVDVPVALSDLLIRAMSKEKDERPPTAAEFAAELAEVEISRGWNRTQFLIRDPGPLGTGVSPQVTRMPDAVPRGLPSTLAPSGPIAPLTPVTPFGPMPPYPPPQPEPAPAAAVHVAPPVAPAPPMPGTGGWSAPTIVPAGTWTPPPPNAARITGPPPPLAPPVAAPASPGAPEPGDGWWSNGADGAPEVVPQLEVEAERADSGAAESWISQTPEPEPDPRTDAKPEPAAEPTADRTEPNREPAPGPTRSRRVPVEIDDEYFPAARPPGFDRQPAPGVPTVPSGAPVAARAETISEPRTEAVPVWAVRGGSQPGFDAPQFAGELSLDPMSLRAKATVRAGASAVKVDERRLRLRTWLKGSEIPWSDIQGFEAQLDMPDEGPATAGQIVALTVFGPVELAGTRRSLAELRYVHALLDAYRIRARYAADR